MNLHLSALFALTAFAGAATLQAAPVDSAATPARVAPAQTIEFDVYLPLAHRSDLQTLLDSLHTPGDPLYQHWLTPAQFHARFDPSPATVQAATQELTALGMTVSAASGQQLHVSGPGAAVERAFNTRLSTAVSPAGTARIVSSTSPTLTPALSSMGAVVTGLSGKIRMHVHSRVQAAPQNRYSTAGSYWFTDLKQAYEWPTYKAYTGKGVTIAILGSGGFQQSDMDLYFSHEKLTPAPTFTEVDIHGGAPYDPDNSLETHLDLQQSRGMAPGSNVVLYNIPELSDHFIIRGLKRIIDQNQADIVSMSFGGPEAFYTAAYNDGVDFTGVLLREDDLMAQGNAQGITFIASSGDSGALSAPPIACFTNADPTAPCGSFQPSANFPASSPHVTGVGGTNLATTYNKNNLNSRYLYEQAYADSLAGDADYGTAATGAVWGSGGGDSVVFRQPLYQSFVKTGNARVRTVPDVSLHMGGCPQNAISCSPDDSGDIVAIDGGFYGVIGTSASAPDFAGLTALAVERFGSRLGNANYYLYGLAAAQNLKLLPDPVFRQDIPGYNGLYSTDTGTSYNRVLGNGTLHAKQFLLAPQVPSAGTPQTPSNP